MYSLTPWTEPTGLDRFRGEIHRLMDQLFGGGPLEGFSWRAEWTPMLDVSESADKVHVKAVLPGVDPKDMDLSLNGRLLTIRGEKRDEHEEKTENVQRVKSRYRSFARSVELPADVNSEHVEANYKDGVLSISLPRTEERSVKKVEVKTP